MKKTIIILAAFAAAFFMSEFVVSKIIKYPKRTSSVKYVFLPDLRGFEILKLKEPYSEFWSVEGENKVFKYNNLSVTGNDMYPDEKSKLIYVLGDSYVEASSVPAEQTGVSVFQKELNKIDTNLKVFNGSYPNSDPYTLWFRTMFFERWYKPEYVILLVTHLELMDMNFQRHPDTLDFTVPENFGKVIPDSKSERYFDVLRKRFSVFNVISTGISIAGVKSSKNKLEDIYRSDLDKSVQKLKACLLKYKEKFGDKFTVVCLEIDESKNKIISDACAEVNVNYANKKLLTPENEWTKGQHLNAKGNEEFGEFLYDTFIRFYKK
ncbi:MAG: hypothetical protein LWX07_09740 [Bacteroidetes bacterium]|nr:hypothetical protein [Bacteroidota bacterium]